MSEYSVRAADCDHRASEDEIRRRELITVMGSCSWNPTILPGPDPANLGSRRKLSGARKDSALWMKWVDPQEAEGEHFEVYENILSDLAEDGALV